MKALISMIAFSLVLMNGAQAYLNVNPSFMEFGAVKVGTIESQQFNLTNMGTQSVNVYGCSSFGSFFCNTNCFGTLREGQICVGTVYFSPNSELEAYQTVNILSSESQVMIQVHGMGKK